MNLPEVFPDGTKLEDLLAAIQAAWSATDIVLAVELAERYGLVGRLCLRCCEVPAVFMLCSACEHEELGGPQSWVVRSANVDRICKWTGKSNGK